MRRPNDTNENITPGSRFYTPLRRVLLSRACDSTGPRPGLLRRSLPRHARAPGCSCPQLARSYLGLRVSKAEDATRIGWPVNMRYTVVVVIDRDRTRKPLDASVGCFGSGHQQAQQQERADTYCPEHRCLLCSTKKHCYGPPPSLSGLAQALLILPRGAATWMC